MHCIQLKPKHSTRRLHTCEHVLLRRTFARHFKMSQVAIVVAATLLVSLLVTILCVKQLTRLFRTVFVSTEAAHDQGPRLPISAATWLPRGCHANTL